jgi:hypothetical protein
MSMGEPARYEPKVLTDQWFEARPFIISVLTEIDGKTPYSTTELGFALTRLTEWALSRAFIDLEREVLFRRDIIDRFITFGSTDLAAGVRGNMRSQLLRVAEELLEPDLARVRMTALSRSRPSAPYSPREIAKMFSWAAAQRTPGRNADAHVLIHLGLGAGLSASEIGNCLAGDVVVRLAGVLINVGGERPRTVPVVEEWEDGIARRAAELDPRSFLFRPKHVAHYPNLVSNFVSKGHTSQHSPQTQRLRATWVVRHLSAGTPVLPLMRAAGVDSLEALTRFMQFVDEPESDAAIQSLRLVASKSAGTSLV